MGDHPWRLASDEVQLATVRAALEQEQGNVLRAAKRLDLARSHLRKILDRLGLREFAAELRFKAGGSRSGRGRPKESGRVRSKK